MRFGPYTIYHAGDGVHYDRLAERLRPYNATAALLEQDRFVEHLLERHPAQRFKVFQCGEGWPIPGE